MKKKIINMIRGDTFVHEGLLKVIIDEANPIDKDKVCVGITIPKYYIYENEHFSYGYANAGTEAFNSNEEFEIIHNLVKIGKEKKRWNIQTIKENKIMNTLVVNLFGVPSAGKTRGSFHICDKLKEQNFNVEYVPEFAREKIHEGSMAVFDNEVYIFGEQYFRISRLYGKVPLIITDRPLPLSILYNNNPILGETYNTLVMNVFNSMNNLNYLILRDENKPFQQSGRQQTKEEALALNEPLMNIMKNNNIKYTSYVGVTEQYDLIAEDIINKLKEK